LQSAFEAIAKRFRSDRKALSKRLQIAQRLQSAITAITKRIKAFTDLLNTDCAALLQRSRAIISDSKAIRSDRKSPSQQMQSASAAIAERFKIDYRAIDNRLRSAVAAFAIACKALSKRLRRDAIAERLHTDCVGIESDLKYWAAIALRRLHSNIAAIAKRFVNNLA
jgi:hypothetical protein